MANYFLKKNLLRAYYQIHVHLSDTPKTAITAPFGLYKFCSVNFGLHNSAQTFQSFMDLILQGLDFATVYIDDILVTSSNTSEHCTHLRQLFIMAA